jgi:organic radical activating enzyme
MHVIPNKVDFYITNVCNLTCENCNRFNNHRFSGWQDWTEYEPIYQEWAKRVKLTAITIMGGEPFLNPTLPDWVRGLNETFGIEVQILTNGTRFRYAKNLYSAMVNRPYNPKNSICVSVHLPEERAQMEEDILSFLEHPVEKIEPEKNSWGTSLVGFCDKNEIAVNLVNADAFGESTIRRVFHNMRPSLSVHDSDPFIAHQRCSFAQWKSYHFIRGKLYKCAPVALLPEFIEQTNMYLTDKQRDLIGSYKPLTIENYDEYAPAFWKELDNPIPQCAMCPGDYTPRKIFPIRKGNHD